MMNKEVIYPATVGSVTHEDDGAAFMDGRK